MNVRTIKVGYLETNCYILEKDNKCIVIDPGDDFKSITNQIGKNHLLSIFVTHNHKDHIGALLQLENFYNVNIYDFSNTEEKKYELDVFNFEIIRTPGHSNDSISFYFYEYQFMFVGDFIFKNTIGRTDLETGNMDIMQDSLNKMKKYSDRIRLYPGHGESTMLGYEKEYNKFLI